MTVYTKTNDGDLLGPMGWGPDNIEEAARLNAEVSLLHAAQDDMPVAWAQRQRDPINDKLLERIEALHQEEELSYTEGSVDLRLVSKLLFGELYKWLAQIIGSCVESGGNRAWTFDQLWQILIGIDPEEPLGKMRLGVDTVSHYGPFSYGDGRKRGGMRGGDGSYCSVQVESYQKTGVLDCNTPALHAITGTDTKDFPEPQDARLYREFGDWKHLEDLRKYADNRLLEAVEVTDAQQSVQLLREFKPHMICSNWGFAPSGEKIGPWHIYKRSGSWAHNMTIIGVIVINGKLYIIVLNSWGPEAHRNGEIFIIPIELYAQWLRSASCIALGDIDLPKSRPVIW